jgi:hypothetical protein
LTDRLKYPDWQGIYLAAMMECDPRRLKAKITAAQDAIHARLLKEKTKQEERQAISDALNALKFFAALNHKPLSRR